MGVLERLGVEIDDLRQTESPFQPFQTFHRFAPFKSFKKLRLGRDFEDATPLNAHSKKYAMPRTNRHFCLGTSAHHSESACHLLFKEPVESLSRQRQAVLRSN
jgi:hypothetical protein